MLYLKKCNLEDVKEEYDALMAMPSENGFENNYEKMSYEEFGEKGIVEIMNQSESINLPDGWVPNTYYFLWDDHKIVGLFKVRHYLNEELKQGGGHIGYAIVKDERGKGYATKGLALTIEKLKTFLQEDEIYMSVNKNDIASLKAQLNNGATIHHEDEEEFYTRIQVK